MLTSGQAMDHDFDVSHVQKLQGENNLKKIIKKPKMTHGRGEAAKNHPVQKQHEWSLIKLR